MATVATGVGSAGLAWIRNLNGMTSSTVNKIFNFENGVMSKPCFSACVSDVNEYFLVLR